MQHLESNAQERYIFGNYEIQDTAGSGGMGVVYRATDLALGRTVALKILRDDLRAQSHIVARFKREAEAFATLDHPNIVHIHTVGEISGIPFFAMDYIDNRTLSEILLDQGAMHWREALAIGRQVADALACAHDKGIIHRDIKPGNILLDDEGAAYVTDFGIAKVLSATTKLTVDGSRLGTPQYMCPERCQNKKITHSSDLYSLGVVLFQAMTMELPYNARTPAELYKQIAAGKTARLSKYIKDIPESVDRLIAYMLESKADNRPPNARELCRAMDRVLAGESLDEGDGALPWLDHQETSKSSLDAPTTAHKSKVSLRTKLAEGWFNLGKGVRLAIAACILLVLMAPVLLSLQHLFMRAPYIPLNPTAKAEALQWNTPTPLLQRTQETDRIDLYHLNFADYSIHSMAPHPSNSQISYAALGMGAAGNQFIELDSHTHQVNRLPLGTGIPYQNALSLADITAGGIHGDTLLLIADGQPHVTYQGDRLPTPLDFTQVQSGIFHPQDERVLLVTAQNDSWSLIETVRQANGPKHTLLQSNSPLDSLAYNTDATLLGYRKQEDTDHYQLFVHHLTRSQGNNTPIAEGAVSISTTPFSTDDRYLLYSLDNGLNSKVILHDLLTNAPREIAPGNQAVWHPSQKYILALAPDHAERTQLWSIQATAPYTRQQLTHLDQELQGTVAVSAQGDHALVQTKTGNTIARIQLAQ